MSQELLIQYTKYVDELAFSDPSEYITPFWKKSNGQLYHDLRELDDDFLNNSIITDTMFVLNGSPWINTELEYILANEAWSNILEKESNIGQPEQFGVCSHNWIHQLYHLCFSNNHLNFDSRHGPIKTVIEWGGGYGALCQQLHLYLNRPDVTYIIIDTSIVSCLQWYYLSKVMKNKTIKMIHRKNQGILDNAINIVPLKWISCLDNKSCDLFVSTWALSESSQRAQEWVGFRNNWFNADSLLLARQSDSELFQASYIDQLIPDQYSVTSIDIEHLPKNKYILASSR